MVLLLLVVFYFSLLISCFVAKQFSFPFSVQQMNSRLCIL